MGMYGVSLQCHMNPGVFHSGFIYPIMLLVQHFNLTLPEIISTFVAVSHIPNSYITFLKASLMILGKYNKRNLPGYCRGFRFGLLIHNLSASIWNNNKVGNERYVRFYTYRRVRNALDFDIWRTICKQLQTITMYTWACFSGKKASNLTTKSRYNIVHKHIQNCMPDCGVLITNHIME